MRRRIVGRADLSGLEMSRLAPSCLFSPRRVARRRVVFNQRCQLPYHQSKLNSYFPFLVALLQQHNLTNTVVRVSARPSECPSVRMSVRPP